MPKPFDAITKHLVESWPGDWLEYAGLTRSEVEVTDVDLSTVTAAADRVLHVRGRAPWLVHRKFQASYNRDPLESAGDLAGKIFLDCTNPLQPDLSGLEIGLDISGGEQVAAWTPAR